MDKINNILEEINLPKVAKVKQIFDNTSINNVEKEIKRLLNEWDFKSKIEK